VRLGALHLALLATLSTLPMLGGCSRKHTGDGTAPAVDRALPPLTIKDDAPNLMLTWIDDKGDTHVELRPADVPAAGRALVRVVVSDSEEGTRDLFYVADLTKTLDDGSHPSQTIRRRDWESEIEKRRDAYLAKTAPPRPANDTGSRDAPPAQQSGAVTVIIYGASWCGPCHQAADYLKSRGVAYVMKDIEETPGAASEMRDKLSRAGNRGGSIPVIDVRGQILVGFSASSLDRALARASAGTML
jgi:glutaredoxin